MNNQDRLTTGARVVVRVASLANRIFLTAAVLGLAASIVATTQFAGLVGHMLPGADIPEAMAGVRWTLCLGIVMSLIADRLLTILATIIASASDPFVAVNAGRLQMIAWCLLALQLCEIPGALITSGYPAMGSAAPGGEFSIAGWISVLMVFVLARVFAVGAAMRDDLAGTI